MAAGRPGARGQQVIEVNFRAERPGSVTNCCEVVAAGGLKAKRLGDDDCRADYAG